MSSIRIVSWLNSAPTGFCIHALAIRIHSADRFDPSATRNVTSRCCDFREPVPAEEEHPDERRLEEERHQPLDRERRAEDVADVVRVVRPVGPELELHRDAGGDAHHEVDAEELAPEPRHVPVDLLARHHVDGLHDHEDPRQPERQRNEQEVVERRRGELQPREVDDVKVGHRGLRTVRRGPAAARRRGPARRSSAGRAGR